jgi:hypothetical protein
MEIIARQPSSSETSLVLRRTERSVRTNSNDVAHQFEHECSNFDVAGTRKMHQKQVNRETTQFVAADPRQGFIEECETVVSYVKDDSVLKTRTCNVLHGS